jgi:hypothetical protein
VENFLELFNEFSAENSPEFTRLFGEIAGELAYRRRLKMEENDRFLQDFKAAWTGYKEQDGSVLDADVPQSYVDEYHRITGKESNYKGQKQVKGLSASTASTSVTASDVGCVIMQAAGTLRYSDPAEMRKLGQILLAAADQMDAAPDPLTGANTSSNREYSQNSKVTYGNPVLKARAERNEREAKKYAEQSGTKYPRWT